MNKSIRWKQRFQNFEKAFKKLEGAVCQASLTEIERAGLIQFFEFSFELAWKTLKDYLESEGFDAKTPRDVFKQAYQIDFIEDGKIWLEALEDRNLTSHTYDEATSLKVEKLIREKYFVILRQLHLKLSEKK